jgi:hypothetical protein
VFPRFALPAREPFCDLRYLVRAGCRAMVGKNQAAASGSFLQIQHFTPILPYRVSASEKP